MHAPDQAGEQQCSCQMPCLTFPLRALGCELWDRLCALSEQCHVCAADTCAGCHEQPPLLLLLQMAPCFGQQHAAAGRQHPAATREAAMQWQDPEAGEDEATQARVRCWAQDSMADQRDKLRQQLMNAFVEVDNLQKFLQYNSEGFRWAAQGCPKLSSRWWRCAACFLASNSRILRGSEALEADAQLGKPLY